MRHWRIALAWLLGLALSGGFWFLQGRDHRLSEVLAAGGKLQCASYTPYVRDESPVHEPVVERSRIEQDFALLSRYFSCVRIYAVKGMQEVPAVAREHGMTVIAGAWINRDDAGTEAEIAQLIALANAWPDVITSVLAGNEVLLRRERNGEQMAAYIQRLKAAVAQPVSYGDVWDFWLQNPQVAAAADYLTIHLLPYWENDPSGIDAAIGAVAHARTEIARAFPGKDILIGETGWPSEGRQRESARPSRVNQALFVRHFIAEAQAQGWRYNLIEAFDQPWKRGSEGAVGGYWGLFDTERQDKHVLSGPVSNLPAWRHWLLLSLGLWLLLQAAAARSAAAVLVAAAAANMGAYHLWQLSVMARGSAEICWGLGLAVAALAVTVAWMRRLAGRAREPWQDAAVLLLAALAGIEMLGLAFDPRYRHFPWQVFATPALAVLLMRLRGDAAWPRARVLGALLACCIPAVLWQETLLNAQALAWVAVMGGLAAGLLWREDQPRIARPRWARHASSSTSRPNTAAGAPMPTL